MGLRSHFIRLAIRSASLLILAALLAPGLSAQSGGGALAEPHSGARGNVLILLADDLGADQVGVYADGPDLPNTPVIDSLAAEGVLFRNAYATPICSPTRACIQTGRYPFRTGIGGIVYGESPALGLEEITLPEMLDAGTGGAYAHAAFGKWHLGTDAVGGHLAPNLAGYSHFAGTMGNFTGQQGYYGWKKFEDGVESLVTNYATTETVDDALDWIQSAPEPWLCYVAFHAPHSPAHVPPAHLHTVDTTPGDLRTLYRAAVEALDTEIGRLLAGLGPAGERTTVMFMGDNGTPRGVLPPSTPFWEAKSTVFEGGIRVPLIVAGWRVTARGGESEAFVHAVDLFATTADLADVHLGGVIPAGVEIDSRSLLPYLRNPGWRGGRVFNFSEEFNLYDHEGPVSPYATAIRDDRYKLILGRDHEFHGPHALYDLWQDPIEEINLLDSRPLPSELFFELQTLMAALKQIHH